VLIEAQDHRRGARHLCVGLSIADGLVYGTCRQRKRCVDFQTFVQEVIIPEALRRKIQAVLFILENGTTYAPKQRESWLREQTGMWDLRLHFQALWLPPNVSWLDQIDIWFSMLQRTTCTAHSRCLYDGLRGVSQRVSRLFPPGGHTHHVDLSR
jgi:hypothetical protein